MVASDAYATSSMAKEGTTMGKELVDPGEMEVEGVLLTIAGARGRGRRREGRGR